MVCDEEKLLFCRRITRRRTILLSQPSVIPNRLSLDSNVPVMRKKMSRTKKIEACGWQEAKQSIREEKEKIWNYFSHFERRKRNLNSLSPVLRREREMWKLFLPFREAKEKSEFPFPSFEKRKRNMKTISFISRGGRESWIQFPQLREEKEKSIKIFLTFEKGNRNFNYISTISRREKEYSFLVFWE